MLFQTPRLIIRNLHINDAIPFHEMEGNANVMRYVSGKVTTFEEDKSELIKLTNYYQKSDNGFWVWAIERKSDNVFVGTSAIIVDDKNEGEIGCRFLEKYWGNGFGSEVAEALIQYGLNEMKLKAMYAYVDILNVASVKILEKTSLEFIREEWNEEEQCTDRFYKK